MGWNWHRQTVDVGSNRRYLFVTEIDVSQDVTFSRNICDQEGNILRQCFQNKAVNERHDISFFVIYLLMIDTTAKLLQ